MNKKINIFNFDKGLIDNIILKFIELEGEIVYLN